MTNGNLIHKPSHGVDPEAESFRFIMQHLFDEGVECSSTPNCDHHLVCSKAQALQRFCERKFAAEEVLLRQWNDPSLAAHVEDHRKFLRTLQSLFAVDGCAGTLRRLKTQVSVWTSGHFAVFDRIAASRGTDASQSNRFHLPISRP